MRELKAVIFDMDGLMFDTESMYYRANQKAAEEIGLPFTYEYYERYIGIADKEFFAALYRDFEDEAKVDAFIEKSRMYLLQQIETDGILIKPGLVNLLQFLDDYGIQRAVASSSIQSMVELCLEKAGVTHYFNHLVAGDHVAHAKPHPEIFEKTWGLFDYKKEETVILEDSLNGIRAAYDAEIPVIMVPDLFKPNQEAREKALAIHKDLYSVKEFLQQKWIF